MEPGNLKAPMRLARLDVRNTQRREPKPDGPILLRDQPAEFVGRIPLSHEIE